jgi:hypothetical protein
MAQESQSGQAKVANVIRDIEARQERSRSALPGYEYLDRESYRLLIPAPMVLEGRGDNVMRVSTMASRMLVLAGDPIAVDDSNDGAMQNAFLGFLHDVFYRDWGGTYRKAKIGKHWGWQITFRLENLAGTASAIIGKGRIVPIVCANQEEHLIFDPTTSKHERAITDAKYRLQRADEESTANMCQQVFQSVELEEDEGAVFSKPAEMYNAAKAQQSMAILQQTAPEQTEASGPALGDLGRSQRTRPVTHTVALEAKGDPDWAPPGFRWLDLSGVCRPLCKSSRALLPDGAKAIPDYREVFRMAVGQAVVSLYVGSVRTWTGIAETAPSLWEQEKFAVPVFHQRWDNTTVTTLHEEEREIHGKKAKISRVRLVDGTGNVLLGEGAVFEVVANIGVGCLIPENKFGEFEPVCATMIDSFEMQ